MSRDLLLDVRWKRKVCASGSKGRRHGNNTGVAPHYREKIHVVGAQLELPELWGTKDKRVVFKDINGKRQCKNITSPFQDGMGTSHTGEGQGRGVQHILCLCPQRGSQSKRIPVP